MIRQATINSRASKKDAIRWRGKEVSRLEALTDGMFGFAITLLIVTLDPPQNFQDLMKIMSGFFPFALCFAMMVWVWTGHNRFFRRFGLSDGWTIVLNSALVFVVLFFVYPLRFVGMSFVQFLDWQIRDVVPTIDISRSDLTTLFVIYGVGFVATFVIFGFMYGRALQLREELELSETEEDLVRIEVMRYFGIASIGVVSIVLTLLFQNPMISGPIYALIGVVEWWHGSNEEKILKARPADAA